MEFRKNDLRIWYQNEGVEMYYWHCKEFFIQDISSTCEWQSEMENCAMSTQYQNEGVEM